MTEISFSNIHLEIVSDLKKGDYDCILVVAPIDAIDDFPEFSDYVNNALKLDEGVRNEITIIPLENYTAKRLIYCPTGSIDDYYDDVRTFKSAANRGIKRAIKAGVKKPIIYLNGHPKFEQASLVTLLGILESLYVPLQIREIDPKKLHSVEIIGVYSKSSDDLKRLLPLAEILDSGRRVACDINESDPERMSPPKVEDYVTKLFANSKVTVTPVRNVEELSRDYPLFEAVNRGASNIERHQGRIIFLEYKPKGEVKETLFLVGKGVTYDTGGLDIKAGGVMAGMSRDKGGAAAVAGFMHLVNLFQPENLRVVGGMSMVRNSCGSNAYVADELIKARSGALVRVGNTDAEGRMVMADVLCKFKELAKDAVNPHLYTIATLTGHACLTVGNGYSIVLDNGPARLAKHAEKLQQKGEEIGDLLEISTVRREDFLFHKGQAVGDDILQCNNQPSSRTARGHQGPAAFLMMTSGLVEVHSGKSLPLKYSHLDIAASAGLFPHPSTGAPVLALANMYLLN